MQSRLVSGSAEAIEDALAWAGIVFDECTSGRPAAAGGPSPMVGRRALTAGRAKPRAVRDRSARTSRWSSWWPLWRWQRPREPVPLG